MKHLKKMLAFAVALAMVVAMSIPAMAATITITQDGETNATEGAETYDLYKIFDVKKTADDVGDTTDANVGDHYTEAAAYAAGTTYYSENEGVYSKVTGITNADTFAEAKEEYGKLYTLNQTKGVSYTISTSNAWFNVLGSVNSGAWTAATGQTWVTLTKSAGDANVYNVTWNGEGTEAEAKAFADWLLGKISNGSPAPDKTITSSNGEATTTEVSDGYYMITSSLGTNLILATSDITIKTKNEYPTTEKKVANPNYNIGDFVKYTITVNLPATVDYTKDVTAHDTMDSVLALVAANSTADTAHGWSATVQDAGSSTTADFTEHVTLVQSSAFASTHDNEMHKAATGKTLFDFVLDLDSLKPAANADPVAKVVVITFYAELTSTAAPDTDIKNKEYVEYSKYKTPESDTTTETFDFQLEKKFTGAASDANLVATFNLYAASYTEDTNGTYYKLKSGAFTATAPTNDTKDLYDGNGTTKYKPSKDTTTGALYFNEVTQYEKYVKKDSNDTGTTQTISAKLGKTLSVEGLAEGTYYLTELTTADGYNLLTEDIVVKIDAEGNATVDGTHDLFSADNSKITVINNSGTVLPSTGGIGTKIFYIVGAILVVGAAVILITRRRVRK